MSLQSRLTALATAIGTDIKALNTQIESSMSTMDTWHTVGNVGEPAYAANWTSFIPVQFRKDPFGKVQVNGVIRNTGGAFGFAGPNNLLLTLPAGYRPIRERLFRSVLIEPDGFTTSIIQVVIGTDGTIRPHSSVTSKIGVAQGASGATGSYLRLDDIEFDTGTVTELEVLITGDARGSIALDPMHIVGTAGQPAFQTTWTNYAAGYQSIGFRKDPFGKVSLFGSAKSGTSGTVIFYLPEGYRPTKSYRFNPRGSGQGNTPWAQINVSLDGAVTGYGDAVNNLISLDGIEFDTETVTVMPTGPQGPKGDPGGVDVYTTLNWNTALVPGFYRSTNDGMLDTINGPGDTLNPPAQAGIVTAHENGSLVQRVWDLDVKRAWMRYRELGGTWTSWALDLTRPDLYTEAMFGGPTPQDGEERFFQNTAMKALGIMWKFRYNAGSASAYKWEFVGGSSWTNTVATTETRANATAGDLTTVGPSITLPLSGDYGFAWGARIQLQGVGPAEGYASMEVGGAFTMTPATQIPSAQFGGGAATMEGRVNGVAEGALARLKYSTQSSISFTFASRWMGVTPIRVSGL